LTAAQSARETRPPPVGVPISNADSHAGRVGHLHAACAAELGGVFASNVPGDWMSGPCIVIVGHDAITAATSETRDAFSSEAGWAQVMGTRFGRAVVNSDEPEHMVERRLWAGAFSPSALERCLEPVRKIVVERIARWAAQPSIDVYAATRDLAFSANATALGGFSDDATLHRVQTLFTEFLNPTTEGDTDANRHQRALPLRDEVEALLRAHVAAVVAAPERKPGVLDELCRKLPEIMQQVLLAHLNLLLVTGSETSASTMAFLLYYASIPQWRDWLREEAEACAAADDLTALESAPRLDAFVRETGRLNPALVCGPRVTTRDVALAGVRIPARSRVMLAYAGTNLLESVYEDAMEFRPQRWIGTAPERPMTFGSGHRTCMGMRFANLEMKLMLAHLVANFDIESVERGPYVNSGFFNTRPAGTFRLRLVQRR
jgi:cytochrome P450